MRGWVPLRHHQNIPALANVEGASSLVVSHLPSLGTKYLGAHENNVRGCQREDTGLKSIYLHSESFESNKPPLSPPSGACSAHNPSLQSSQVHLYHWHSLCLGVKRLG